MWRVVDASSSRRRKTRRDSLPADLETRSFHDSAYIEIYDITDREGRIDYLHIRTRGYREHRFASFRRCCVRVCVDLRAFFFFYIAS